MPLGVLSLWTEGGRTDLHALGHLGLTGLGALLYVAWGATLVGYGL